MAPRQGRDDAVQLRLAEIAAILTAAVSVLAVVGFERTTVIAIVVPILAASFFILVAGRRAVAVRTIPLDVALGGSVGVGKTVYANVVSNVLSEGQSELLSFVPETVTAQHVYRVISGLRRDEWPGRTGADHIDRYRGRVELVHQTLLARLIRGKIEFAVEIADSAGELWDEVGKEEGTASRLIESTFFEYVGESTALLYFIDSETLKQSPDEVDDHVDDLLSTLQVLRSIEGRGRDLLRKPIAVVVSKADLLTHREISSLRSAFAGDSESRTSDLSPMFRESLKRLDRLTSVMTRQTESFSGHVVSAINAADRQRDDPDALHHVERPIEWVVWQVLRSSGRFV
jgi:Double-GTPase 2